MVAVYVTTIAGEVGGIVGACLFIALPRGCCVSVTFSGLFRRRCVCFRERPITNGLGVAVFVVYLVHDIHVVRTNAEDLPL